MKTLDGCSKIKDVLAQDCLHSQMIEAVKGTCAACSDKNDCDSPHGTLYGAKMCPVFSLASSLTAWPKGMDIFRVPPTPQHHPCLLNKCGWWCDLSKSIIPAQGCAIELMGRQAVLGR